MKKLFVFLLLGVFMISFASAAEWDNAITDYNQEEEIITFGNGCLFDFGWTCIGGEIGKVQLKTPRNFKVAAGYNYVWEMDAWVEDDYNDFLKGFEFIDLNNGKQKINRDIDIKILSYEDVEVNDYENVLVGTSYNGTAIYEYQIVGSHIETQEVWSKVTPADLKKADGKVTLRGYTDVQVGDSVDWSPVIFGVRVPHDIWASWTADMNVGLISYYKLDESSGVVVDSLGINNGTNNGATRGVTGKINNSFDFTPTDKVVGTTDTDITEATTFSVNVWLYMDKSQTATEVIFSQARKGGTFTQYLGVKNTNEIIFTRSGGSGWSLTIDANEWNANEWNMITYTNGGSNGKIYINGILADSGTNTLSTAGEEAFSFGGNADESGTFDGKIDEFGFWDRVLTPTEINETLYNNNNGNTYTDVFKNINIVLNSPQNNISTTNTTIDFNATVTATGLEVVNVSLLIDGVINDTNTSGLTGDYIFTEILSTGDYNWSISVVDNESNTTVSETRNLTIDATIPQIEVESPVGTYDYNYIGGNETLNVTFIDDNLDSCWYNYNGTNVTIGDCINGTKNSTQFILEEDNLNMTLYANDTLGNLNSTFTSWGYTMLEINQTYDNLTFETLFNNFEIQIESSASSITNPKLIYTNGVNMTYAADLNVVDSTHFYLNSSIVSNESFVGNNSFYWNVTLDGTEYSTRELNQTILGINFSLCGGSNNITYLSIDFKDELTLESINATIRTATFNYFVDDAEAYKTYTFFTAGNNSQYDFCFDPSIATIINDFSISYYADGYPERTFGSVFELTNESTNLTLNLLDDSSGIYATFKFIDSTTKIGLAGVNVLIYDGVDLVVEKITDDGGLVSEWLNPNILYEIQYTKIDYTGGSQSHRPISAETIPIEMSSDSLIPDKSITNGLTQYYYPQLTDLEEDTNYTFGYYVSPGEEEIELMQFAIFDEDGTFIDGAQISGDGNISLSQPLNTSQNKTLLGVYEINGTEGGYYRFTRKYYVTVIVSTQYSLDQWGTSLNTYFPADERSTLTNLIWYIIWFICMLGGFTFGFNGSFNKREDYTDNVTSGTRGNTTSGLFFAFIITIIFTYFNMIPMPIGVINPGFLIPDAWMEQNFMGLIILVVLVWDVISGITKHSRRGN